MRSIASSSAPGADRDGIHGGVGLTGPTQDRRSFLRRLGLSTLAAPTLPWVACVPEPSGAPAERARASAGGAEDPRRARLITRPILIARSDGDVRMVSPPWEMPAAYVSMATRQLFVDFDYRDQAYWDLHAHISVSTGVWRIPLVEDPPKYPITPGDELREFEELTMRDWDPTAEPAEGDIRIVRGAAVPTRVELSCAPLAGGSAWLRAGPWDFLQGGEPNETLCREDFVAVGTAERYADRDCTNLQGSVRVLTWSALPEFLPSQS